MNARFTRFGAVLVVAVAASLLFAAQQLGGPFASVTTHGNSMEPRIHQGDLVLVRESPTYEVGDSTAYWSDELDTVVLHRIVAVEDGRYTFQGDNNSWLDPETPTEDKLIGKEFVHIPQGGIWLDRVTSPAALGLIAFGLLATGGTAVRRKHGRRRRTVSQHAARTPKRAQSLAGLPSWATTAATGAAGVGVLGVALGAFAWTTPAAPTAPAVATTDSGQSMIFSYTADVPQSPAYDDTTVDAPQPIFRKLTDDVEVEYTYTGDSGSISVAAELSTASGWRSTVPLAAPQRFDEDAHTGTVSLDLKALEKRAQSAAEVTGIPASQVDVKVVPTVITEDDKKFQPELALTLTPLQLTLAGDEAALTVGDGGTAAIPQAAATTPTIGLAGREMPVSTARILSLVMALGALIAAAALGFLARASAPATEAAAIRRRYSQMLVKVQPMPAPAGRPVVDVVDFATLAKLAERYELLVLHWSRSDVDTFVVQDQGTTYRYRTGTGVPRNIDEAVFDTVTEPLH
jgi:signal peptidase I